MVNSLRLGFCGRGIAFGGLGLESLAIDRMLGSVYDR
jgi:hypothetical protein